MCHVIISYQDCRLHHCTKTGQIHLMIMKQQSQKRTLMRIMNNWLLWTSTFNTIFFSYITCEVLLLKSAIFDTDTVPVSLYHYNMFAWLSEGKAPGGLNRGIDAYNQFISKANEGHLYEQSLGYIKKRSSG